MATGTRPPMVKRWQVVSVLLICVPICGYGYYRHVHGKRVEAALDKIRAQGCPATLAELDAWYVEPEFGENAAETIAAAIAYLLPLTEEERLQLPVFGDVEWPDPSVPLPAEFRDRVRAYLEAHAPCLELLHEAAMLPGARWPMDMTQGMAVELPHLAKIRQCARLLSLEAVFKAATGDAEGAVEAISAGSAVARSLSQEPILISQLVRIACDAICLATLEETLSRVELTEEQLDRLDKALQDAEACDGFARGMAGERCMGADAMRTGGVGDASGQQGGGATLLVRFVYAPLGLRDMDLQRYLAIMGEIVEAAEMPVEQRDVYIEAIEAQAEAIPPYLIFSALLTPSLTRANAADARNIAQIRAARAALAVERYRLETGVLPAAWGDLIPTILTAAPIDPYDGAPLRYKQTDNGYLVYSVSADCEDDGGQKWQQDSEQYKRWEDADLVFAVKRK